MAISPSTKMTLAEYLEYDDDTERRYEFVDGELVIMAPESGLNEEIASLLFEYLLKKGIPSRCIRRGSEVVTPAGPVNARIPDLMVVSKELADKLKRKTRATIELNMEPPELVVEVVSPGKENRERDYLDKVSEYAARGIEEYWIVDPREEKVVILGLVSGEYRETVYEGAAVLKSLKFGEIGLTAEQLVNADPEQELASEK